MNSFDAFGRKQKRNGLFQLGNINLLFLEVRIFADRAGRVELRGAGSVGISAAHSRAFSVDWTFLSHNANMLSYIV